MGHCAQIMPANHFACGLLQIGRPVRFLASFVEHTHLVFLSCWGVTCGERFLRNVFEQVDRTVHTDN